VNPIVLVGNEALQQAALGFGHVDLGAKNPNPFAFKSFNSNFEVHNFGQLA
jgi:hypothetical protein